MAGHGPSKEVAATTCLRPGLERHGPLQDDALPVHARAYANDALLWCCSDSRSDATEACMCSTGLLRVNPTESGRACRFRGTYHWRLSDLRAPAEVPCSRARWSLRAGAFCWWSLVDWGWHILCGTASETLGLQLKGLPMLAGGFLTASCFARSRVLLG
jgi:hypothetical protein